MEWWQKHMRKSLDFLTLPNHLVAVTGIPNVKQKVVRGELGSKRSFEGNGESKEPPGIHPSSQGALWSVLQNQVCHLEKPSHIPSKISLMFLHKKVLSQVEDHYMSTHRGTKMVCMLLERIYGGNLLQTHFLCKLCPHMMSSVKAARAGKVIWAKYP